MRLVRGALVIAVLSAGGACAAFSASPDEVVSPAPEGGAEAASSIEASVEAEAPEAAPGDAGPFCATVDAQFCWSFDGLQQPLLGPTLTTQATGAPPTVVGTGLSAPNAMAASLSKAGNAGVNLDVAKDVSHLGCELDLFFDKTESATTEQVAIAQLDWVGSSFVLPVLRARKVDATTLRVALNIAGAADVDLGNIPVAQWVHAFFDTDIVEGRWRVRARMLQNGEGTLDAGARAALPRFNRVFFGLATFTTTLDWRVRYDNLVCYWR